MRIFRDFTVFIAESFRLTCWKLIVRKDSIWLKAFTLALLTTCFRTDKIFLLCGNFFQTNLSGFQLTANSGSRLFPTGQHDRHDKYQRLTFQTITQNFAFGIAVNRLIS
jgi:hypothetical protein